MKWGYTASLSAAAICVTSRLARSDSGRLRGLWFLAAPVLVLAAIAILDLARAPREDLLAMWLGTTWRVCTWLVLALSAPIFVGLLWSFRRRQFRHARTPRAACSAAPDFLTYT